MKSFQTLAGAVLFALAGSTVVSCGASTANGQSITVYSGQHPQTTAALITAFERQSGITVAERDNDEDALASQIIQEGGRSPADVVFTENSLVLQFLQENGRLAKIPASVLKLVPSKFNSPHGNWIGVSARVNLIVYNKKLIRASQLPTSLAALSDPRFKGKLGLAPTETDLQPVVTSMDEAEGEPATLKWLEGVKSNAGSKIFSDNETLVSKVNSGAVAFAVMNQYYWYRLEAELGPSKINSAIAYFAPRDPGYIIDVSGAGVLSSSVHQRSAQKFIAFLVSKAGQKIIAESNSFEYPIGSGVTSTKPETPFKDLQPRPQSISDLGDGRLAISLLQKAGLS